VEFSKPFIFESLVVLLSLSFGCWVWFFWTKHYKKLRNRRARKGECLRFYYRVRQLNELHNSIARFHKNSKNSIKYFSPRRNAKESLEDFDRAVEKLKEEFSDVIIDDNDWTRFALSRFNDTRTMLLADIVLEELEPEILAKPAYSKGKRRRVGLSPPKPDNRRCSD